MIISVNFLRTDNITDLVNLTEFQRNVVESFVMNIHDMTNEQIIEKLLGKFCHEKLDGDYLNICNEIKQDYLDSKPGTMNRGQPEIWAASLIWAMGSVNFFPDPIFSAYPTLSDICAYFNTKKSTIGNKAGEIRKVLDIQFFNDKYTLWDSPFLEMMKKMRITKEGFVVFDHLLGGGEEDTEPDLEDDGTIAERIINGTYEKPIERKIFYQLEFQIQKMVKDWIKNDGRERTVRVTIREARKLSIQLNCTKTEDWKLRRWMKGYGFEEF